MAYHPGIRQSVAETVLALEAARPGGTHRRRLGEQCRPRERLAAQARGPQAQRRGSGEKVMDLAMAVSGGAGMFKRN